MFDVIARWYKRRFSDPHMVTLFLLLVFGVAIIYFLGNLIAPLLAAMVIAYLLDWPVTLLCRLRINRTAATTVVVLLFLSLMALMALSLLPNIWRQSLNLLKELPSMLNQAQSYLLTLPDAYPELFDAEMIDGLVQAIRGNLLSSGESLLTASLLSLIGIAALVVYAILVPLLVFFMLKDKHHLLASIERFLPDNRQLAAQVWTEMNAQIVNYIRGKVMEILIVGSASYIVFMILGLNYALLLGVLVGLSVLIPYIGAAAVTVPVAMVGLFQWGVTAEFGYLMAAYAIIQALDGNVLVPVLFSEAVNLHPIAIIIAVLVFGGLWGFWGVFFAIPLATLVKAVINAWVGGLQAQSQDRSGEVPQP